MRNHTMKQGVIRVLGIEVGWVGIARDGGKCLDVFNREGSHQARTLPHRDFVVQHVFNKVGVCHWRTFNSEVLTQATAWQPAST